jgi:TolB-like protein/Tfp pilus assembly protein PilF
MATEASAQACRLGKFSFDPSSGALSYDREIIFLRPKAQVLLSHLVRNAGSVVSKSELLDAVWPEVTVTEDSLTQCVREIRKALGDEASALVRTVSRRGYMLAVAREPDLATDAPAVAVLRFHHGTDDPTETAISDGIAEDILNGLGRFRAVTVLARSTSFAVSGEAAQGWRTLGEKLGADYFVDGDIKRFGGTFDVGVRLTEASRGVQLWSDRYLAQDTEIFSVQNEIAHRIVSRLVSRLEDAGLQRMSSKPTDSLAAYELVLRGIAALRGYRPQDNEDARQLFEAAIEKDPHYGVAQCYLALSQVIIGGYAMASTKVLAGALDLALKGVTLAPEDPRCHRILAIVRLYLRQHDAAEQHVRRSLDLNPHDADTVCQMGYLLTMRGRPLDGLAWIDRALCLNPIHPDWYHYDRSVALYSIGEYRSAATELERLPLLGPGARVRLAACYAQMGELQIAKQHLGAAAVAGFSPLDYVKNGIVFEHAADIEHLVEGVRKASAQAE